MVAAVGATAAFQAPSAAGQVILVGAHLDSVSAGPGINDNGSGVAALIELAREVGSSDAPANMMRFAWWTASEQGTAGSEVYAYSLAFDEMDDLAMYLDLDSIASTNYVYGVLDGDLSDTEDASDPTLDPWFMAEGSTEIEAAFTDYFASQGISSQPMPLTGTPDYNPFINIGIPVGGLFSGEAGLKTVAEAETFGGTAGQAYDPCYHMACDDMDNIDQDVLLTNAAAISSVARQFAGQATLFQGNTAARRPMARRPMARKAGSVSRSAQKASPGYDRFHGDRHLRSSE